MSAEEEAAETERSEEEEFNGSRLLNRSSLHGAGGLTHCFELSRRTSRAANASCLINFTKLTRRDAFSTSSYVLTT